MNHTCEIHNSTRYGFDYLLCNEIEYGENTITVDILSSYDIATISNWYELTGSPVYVLNNYISKDDLPSKLGNVINAEKLRSFYESIGDDEGFGDVTFQLSANYPTGYTFPNYFKYNQSEYNKV